jgi:hypothetical protein
MPGDAGRDVRQNLRGLTRRMGLRICSIEQTAKGGPDAIASPNPVLFWLAKQKTGLPGRVTPIRSILLRQQPIQVIVGETRRSASASSRSIGRVWSAVVEWPPLLVRTKATVERHLTSLDGLSNARRWVAETVTELVERKI